LSGDKFKDLFYSVIDAHRDETHKFFHEHGVITWDGNRASGQQEVQQWWKMMPSTHHDVRTFDSQPILLPQEMKGLTSPSMLVVVTGIVKYGAKTQPHCFYHCFVLERDIRVPPSGGEFYVIAAMTVRTQKATASQLGPTNAAATVELASEGGGSSSNGSGGSERGRGRGRGIYRRHRGS